MDSYIKHLQETYNNTTKYREKILLKAKETILYELCESIDIENEGDYVSPVASLSEVKINMHSYALDINLNTLQKSIQEDLPKGMDVRLYYETEKVCDTRKPNFFGLSSNCTYVKNLMAELKW